MTQVPGIMTLSVNTRIRPSSDIVQLCDYKVQTAFSIHRFSHVMLQFTLQTEYRYPQAAKNQKGELLPVVNQDNTSQLITVELCR